MSQSSPRQTDQTQGRKARTVGAVVAVTMGLWMAVQVLGGVLGLPARYAFLFDFAALAAFVWSLVVIFQLWQARKRSATPANRG